MTLFIISVSLVLIVSAICSLTEAGFYAVRLPYIRTLADSGNLAGQVLARFKDNMERPIAAILIVNTVANTAGAAIAGAQARVLFYDSFGEVAILAFSAIFTVAVLFFSEIIPKVIGVAYSQPVSRLMAVPWAWIIWAISPVIWVVEKVTRLFRPSKPVLAAPEEEVEQMARMSAEEGSILNYEAELVKNVLQLDDVTAREIMTPRPVVVKLANNTTLKEASTKLKRWVHSRIPIYSQEDPETWTGFVLTRDILSGLANDQFDRRLDSMAKPLFFVPEDLAGHMLLKSFIKRRTHLFGVMDNYGDLTGIVTLEDVLESLIGEEIVDEVDTVADMQEVALRRKREQFYRQERQSEREDSPPNTNEVEDPENRS